MKQLYVLYDADCTLCRRVRVWLSRQPAFVPLVFIPLQSPEIACRFPGVEGLRPEEELVAISDEGDAWHGGHAWITVLWALREYREWAQRLAHPTLLPFARRACALVSENRHAISRWFAHGNRGELRNKLAAAHGEACVNQGYCKAP